MHATFERALENPITIDMLVGLCDWRLFLQFCDDRSSAQIFAGLNDFYLLTEDFIEAAGGHVVKFMGDAALIIFPEDLADPGVLAFLELKQQTDAWFERNRIHSSLHVNVHFGVVTLGRMGKAQQLDVIGQTVNTTATMGRRDFALSQQAFRRLTPEHRRLFRRFTPPILYLPVKIEP